MGRKNKNKKFKKAAITKTENKNNIVKLETKIESVNTDSIFKDSVKDSENALVVTDTTKNTTKTTNATNTTNNYKSYFKSYKTNYDYKGRKNQTNYPEFVNICLPSQEDLKKVLETKLIDAGYTDLVNEDGYLYAKGTIPVLLTAHMDTVHRELVKDFYEYYDEEKKKHYISSPQGIGGDDRCGIYMILEIIKTHKCSILFCEDEESGGIGSNKFCKTEFINELSDLNYLIELDRANETDAVFYDCENNEFTDFIEKNTGYKEAYGSFSDISNLSPYCRVASVNLSCGYHNAHTTSEYVVVEEMFNTIDVVKKLLDVECEQFEYIEKVYPKNWYGGWNDDWYDDYYGYGNYGGYGSHTKRNTSYDRYDDGYTEGYEDGYWDGVNSKSNIKNNKIQKEEVKEEKETKEIKEETKDEETTMLIHLYGNTKSTITYASNGKSEAECFGKFFMKNPDYSFYDVQDYEMYPNYICGDGWLSY